MDLNRLKIFYYVAQAKSLTHSGLHLTRSAISRHISMLEHQLKVSLFQRHPRELILTPEGEKLYRAVHKIFGEIENIVTEIKADHSAPAGQIKIYTHSGWASSMLVRFLSEFTREYKDVNASIIATDTIPDFSLSSTHIAILPSTLANKNLVQRKLFTFKMKLGASKKYIKDFGMPQCVEDLDKHMLLGYGEHKHHLPTTNWHLSLGMPPGEKRQPVLMVNTLYYAITQGLGIAPICRPLLAADDHDLVDVLPKHMSDPVDVYFIFPKHLEKYQRVTLLCDYIQERVQSLYGEKIII